MNSDPTGIIRISADLGGLVRAHRKARKLDLETVSGLANVGVRFLSEFERGKETAEIGKVLKVLQVLGLRVTVTERHIGTDVCGNHPNASGCDDS